MMDLGIRNFYVSNLPLARASARWRKFG